MKKSIKVAILLFFITVNTHFCVSQITYDYYKNPEKIGSSNPNATKYFIKSFEFIMQWGAEDTDSAIFYMQKAIGEDSLYAIAYASLGHMIKYGGYNGTTIDRDSVAKLAEKSLKINPKCGDAHTLMSWVYEMKNEYSKAIASCKKAVEAEPNHRETWFWLGVRYSSNPEKLDSAIWAFNKSLEVDPLFGQPHQKLGWIYIYNQADYQKAAFHFRKMVYLYENVKPQDERLLIGYYGLGEALLHNAKWDDAIDTLKLLLKKSETSSLLWIDKLKSMTYSALIRCNMGKAKSELDHFIALNLGRQDKSPKDIGITISLIEEFDALSFQLKEYNVEDTLKKVRLPLYQKVLDNATEDYQINQAITYKCYQYIDEKKYEESNKWLGGLLKKYSNRKELVSGIYYCMALNFMMMKDTKHTISYLKKAVNKGYNDFITLKAQFYTLEENTQFKKIVQTNEK
jgi:tetratricopeptide (TPR) repeat protein